MTNLYEDTVRCLRWHDKAPKDVLWVSDGRGKYCTWFEFAREAENFYFDSGYGCQEVAPKLVVCGDDWWLERREYDGSEWWEYCTMPKRPAHEGEIDLNAD